MYNAVSYNALRICTLNKVLPKLYFTCMIDNVVILANSLTLSF